jgi:hypothetical protein
MDEHLTTILDALEGVKLLPRRAFEADVVYGYIGRERLAAMAERISATLHTRGYEVHRCEWADEVVLLALDGTAHPFALRLTASAAERYNLYALSRPQTAQALWQWAQAMLRQRARQRRESR